MVRGRRGPRLRTRTTHARRGALVLMLGLGVLGASVLATDHPIGGDLLRLRDPVATSGRRAQFRAARDGAIVPGTDPDPSHTGATLEIIGSGVGDGTTGPIALPPSGWSPIGKPSRSRGYVFVSRSGTQGVRKVTFKATSKGGLLAVNARGSGWPFVVSQPQGPIDVRFTLRDQIYCARFTSFITNTKGRVLARLAPAPASCGVVSPKCGNGTVEGTEECDDGNPTSGDGCSSTCELESTQALCAGITPVSGTGIDTALVATGLTSPTYLTAPRLDPRRLFVVEQPGRVRIIKDGVLLVQPFLAIENKVASDGERGLLSLAFHPAY